MRIGVFDSGVGGRSVANAIERALPGFDLTFRNDAVHVPYGTRELEEIYGFTRAHRAAARSRTTAATSS